MDLSRPETRGERFSFEREKMGKSLDEVAAATGLSKPTIWALEHDPDPIRNEQERDVGYLKVVELAKYYNVSVDYLLGLSPYRSSDTSIQGVEKVTGLSETAIECLQHFNNSNPESAISIGFARITNFMAMERLNSFLEHPKLGEFIYNINKAIQYSEFEIPNGTTGKDVIDVEKAAGRIGSYVLFQDDAIKYFRQEAINALRDIVYDLVPEKEEKDYGNSHKTR